MIDLRSDTVTRPSAGMRRAMAAAEVGDDVFGEDPTTIALQNTVATMLGKEAALFVPSGMMGNQLGIYVHTRPGDEVILDRQSHIFNYESGSASSLCGVTLHPIDGQEGRFSKDQLHGALRYGHYWESRSALLCLENTLNIAGGLLYPLPALTELANYAHSRGLSCHLDGARLWNASVATGIPVKDYAAPFDTVTVCLSKGLGAPVGSVFAGTRETIERAHRRRKELGAGMRQLGILAAAGLYALEHHLGDLERDHANARHLAEGLAALDSLDIRSPETNIVLINLRGHPTGPLLKHMHSEGVAMVPIGPATIRATVHRDVCSTDIDTAVESIARALKQL